MNSIFNSNHFVSELENSLDNSPENSGDSPSSAMAKETKISSTSSSKIRRGAIKKRVVSVAIKDVEKLRLKGDQISSPPSDSWAWRKYGQKPIKGSPYPRGYYKCSSSKGCPARKQVERSRVDPNMLMVTYSCEHNHPLPPSRNNHHRAAAASASAAAVAATATISTTTSVSEEELEEEDDEEEEKPINLVSSQSHELIISENKFSIIGEGPLVNAGEFGWFTDFEYTSSTMLDSPILMEERSTTDQEMAMIFTMREEDDSDLFADLGELPECSTVFRRGMAQREAERRRHSLATTG